MPWLEFEPGSTQLQSTSDNLDGLAMGPAYKSLIYYKGSPRFGKIETVSNR